MVFYVVKLICVHMAIFTGWVIICPKVSPQLSADFKVNNNFLMVMRAAYNILSVAGRSYLFIMLLFINIVVVL